MSLLSLCTSPCLASLMLAIALSFVKGAPSYVPSQPGLFVEEPEPEMRVLNGTSLTLTWRFHRGIHNDWIITVSTQTFNLHQPSYNIPTRLQDHYNVTVTSNAEEEKATGQADQPQDGNVTTVTMNILVNDILVKDVPYVFCKLYRDGDTNVTGRSGNVSFIITELPTTVGATTTEQTMKKSTETAKTETRNSPTTSFGNHQSLHALGLSLSLLVTIIYSVSLYV